MPIKLVGQARQLFQKTREVVGDAIGIQPMITKAEEQADEFFGAETSYQGESDAMRHILFSAMATKAYGGETAPKIMSFINEEIKGRLDGSSREDRDMDSFNDRLGREIGLRAKDEKELFELAREAVSSGKAKVIRKKATVDDELPEEAKERLKFEKMQEEVDQMK
jgi:hypothetical protein